MINQLHTIISQKHHEVKVLQEWISAHPTHPLVQILQGKKCRKTNKSFKNALRGSSLAVIAEIKRRSPSKGALAEIKAPVSLAEAYVTGEANAISVLTDEKFFGGSLTDLTQISHAFSQDKQPILRKDFIIHEIQIAEAILAGADAILLIVAVLGAKTKVMLAHAERMGIEVLVEVHNEAELEMAVLGGAEILGINNRDLTTFHIDTQQALHLIEKLPSACIKVAESGILSPELAQTYYRAGFDAVLIGEALVKAPDPAAFIRACRHA